MTALMMVRRRANGASASADVELLARQSGLHPELVRRYIAIGAVDPGGRDAAARLARFARLRRDLALNCAGALLAMELISRIEELEARLSRYESPDDRPR